MKTPEECRKMSQICRLHSVNVLAGLFNSEDKQTKENIKLALDGIVQAAVLETAALLADSRKDLNPPRRTQ